jgi:hypothetical protein
MKFTGQLQWTDYLNAQLLHMKPKGGLRIINYVICFALALEGVGGFYLLYLFTVEKWHSGLGSVLMVILIPVFFLLFGLLLRYVILPNRIKKIFTQQKELHAPFEMEITDSNIAVSSEFGNAIRPWNHFIKWKENEELITLYHSDVMFTIIPKRLFTAPQQLQTIKSLIQKNGIRAA